MKVNQRKRVLIISRLLMMTLCLVLGLSLFSMGSYANEGHEHTEECYAKEGDLLCTIPENEGHVHNDECYTEQSNLICELEENEEHTHSEECYEIQKVLTCTLEEMEGHTHSEDCFAKGGELICEEEEVELLSDANEVDDFESLKKAVANAENAVTEIVISNDIDFTETLVIPKGKNILLRTNNPVTCISTNSLSKLPMIQVEEESVLVFDGDITLDGSKAQRYVHSNGAFIMKKGTLTGCNISTSTNGLGGVTVEGANASFTLNGGSIENTKSSYGFKAAVYIKDGANMTINGGSIKDNSFDNQFCAAVVIDNAQLEMNGGEISNNKTEFDQIQSAGGVLVLGYKPYSTQSNAKTSSFVMNNGKISGNSAFRGGGVYVFGGSVIYTDFYSKAYFTMNGGEISNNRTAGFGSQLSSAGAGVYVEWAGEFTMNGGSIRNNATEGMGGGVATNDAFTNYFGTNPYSAAGFRQYNGLYYRNWDKIFPAAFTMNGGSITGNTAMSTDVFGDRGCGGGVYIASNNVVLNAGDISNNQSGKQGGGVYVGSVPYVVQLGNALITNNSASIIGGGIWVCPTGTVDISVNNGSALYGNTAKDAGDDYAAVHTITKRYETTISDRMLGGGLANWYQDGGIDTSGVLGYADDSTPRYDKDGKKNTPVSKIIASKEGYALKAMPSKDAQESAKALTTLTITGNTSRRGGGIGSNGGITVGDTFDLTRDLTIDKEWIGSDNLPDTVTIWVLVNGIRIEKAVVTKKDNWSKTITGLPVGDDISITVEEEQIDNWAPKYDYKTEENGNIIASVTNTYKTGDLEVNKTVTGQGADKSKKFAFTVVLSDNKVNGTYGDMTFKDGVALFDLKDGDKKTAVNLPAGISYRVTEESEDYTVSKTGDTGIIVADKTAVAAFENHKSSTEKTSISVEKKWKGDKEKSRPTYVTVQLYKDGKAYGDVVKLSKKNNWKYEWKDLDTASAWSVDEVKVPKGYQKKVTHKDTVWTITNTSTDNPPTGVDSNITRWTMISVLSCIAILVMIIIRGKILNEYK